MYTLKHFLTEIPPLVIIPYTILVLLVIANFIYEKYLIRKAIRGLSFSTECEDVNRIKNLRIKSLVHSFIIFLTALEIVVNISFESGVIMKYDFNPFHPNHINVSNSCLITDPYLISLVESSYLSASLIFNISIIIGTSIIPIISLFFVILRRIYINYPYKQYIRKYVVLIALRFVVMAILYCLMQTWYLVQLLLLPIFLIDLKIYISSSRKFYFLLRGLRNEASIHSTKQEYRNKSRIVNQFFYAQVVSLFTLSIGLGVVVLCSLSVPLRIYVYNPCYLSYITLGYLPIIRVSKRVQDTGRTILYISYVIESTCLSIIEVLVIFTYLSILISIVIKLIKRRRDFNQVNEFTTRLLINDYRNTLLKKR